MSALLGYETGDGDEAPERIWVDTPGSHRVCASCKQELLAAMHELKPREGARLVVLGVEVGPLPEDERRALLGKIAFVPAHGGLISSLNAWENISLPVAYHAPARLPGLLEQVHELLEQLGGVDQNLLAKLPEDMTLYEKRLAGYVRALTQTPQLLLVENLAAGLGPTKRERAERFADTYHARCPGGTLIQLDE
jgi:ABC-type transporter Mla maintaining outer membrane lipid asymmetry ATPase subunit MlaF